ncbi:MAG: hypothetical protein QXD43_03445 [Candidatus Aenigmatarchaeota archaeon]
MSEKDVENNSFIKAKFTKTKDGKTVLYFYNLDKKKNNFEELINKEFTVLHSDEKLILLINNNFAEIKDKEKTNINHDRSLIELAKKIINLERNERTIENIKKIFSPQEVEVIEYMIKKKLLTISTDKNGKETIFINKELFKKAKMKDELDEKEKTAKHVFNLSEKSFSLTNKKFIDYLKLKGYLVIDNENDLKEFLSQAENDLLSEKIFGLKDFDNKYYYTNKEYYEKVSNQIYQLLKESKEQELSIIEIIENLRNYEEEGIKTVIAIMREKEGDIIEVRKGIFKKVD